MDTDAPIYDGDGENLMEKIAAEAQDRLLVLPDRAPGKDPVRIPRLRVMWGQHLMEDLLEGRYRSLVCVVNAVDNSRGIISQLASLLPASQWDNASITHYASQFATGSARAKVLKYDMDLVEVLAVLRPPDKTQLELDDLAMAFHVVSEMIARHSHRWPSASVSFLGARANRLVGKNGVEPSFESVLRVMHEAGYTGDIYPSPGMWRRANVGVYPRYPFPDALDVLRQGGS